MSIFTASPIVAILFPFVNIHPIQVIYFIPIITKVLAGQPICLRKCANIDNVSGSLQILIIKEIRLSVEMPIGIRFEIQKIIWTRYIFTFPSDVITSTIAHQFAQFNRVIQSGNMPLGPPCLCQLVST